MNPPGTKAHKINPAILGALAMGYSILLNASVIVSARAYKNAGNARLLY